MLKRALMAWCEMQECYGLSNGTGAEFGDAYGTCSGCTCVLFSRNLAGKVDTYSSLGLCLGL